MKYRLEVSEKQLNLICEALESYSRIGAGQIATRYIPILENVAFENGANRDMVDYHLGEAKKEIFREHEVLSEHPGASIGIGQSSDDIKIMYELYKMIKYQREKESMEKQGENYSSNVHTNGPNKMTNEPLMKIEKVTDRQLKLERIIEDEKH